MEFKKHFEEKSIIILTAILLSVMMFKSILMIIDFGRYF